MGNNDVPAFFVPGATDAESAWGAMHEASESAMSRAYSERRIYALSFTHDGIDYVAEVGKPRQATEYSRTRGKRDYSRPPRQYSSGGVVAAIFEGKQDGAPYLIWELPANRPSAWENPAMVGREGAKGVREFS